MLLIPFKKRPAAERRPAFFLPAFEREQEMMRIVSFGRCNFQCPYCKRDGQFTDRDGNIYTAIDFPAATVYAALTEALNAGERIRLSGGDPVAFPAASLEIARWATWRGKKISIAHNGSSPALIELLLPHLDYAAIDLKAATPEEYNRRAGIRFGEKALASSLECQRLLSEAGVLVDVRTCVFADTSLDEFLQLARLVAKSGNATNKFWTVRAYKPVRGLDWQPLPRETAMEYAQVAANEFPHLSVGMRVRWKGGFVFF